MSRHQKAFPAAANDEGRLRQHCEPWNAAVPSRVLQEACQLTRQPVCATCPADSSSSEQGRPLQQPDWLRLGFMTEFKLPPCRQPL